MTSPGQSRVGIDTAIQAVVALGASRREAARPRFTSSPMLRALSLAGTAHIYADTADRDELADLLEVTDGEIYREIDGNTINQPLLHKVLDRYLADREPSRWLSELRPSGRRFSDEQQAILLYTIVCARVGNEILRGFAGGRSWEISLQLHMGLVASREEAMRAARMLREAMPMAIIKVPFAPHAPETLLVARDLEREGIPVNVTSTFSARQAVAAGLLCNASRTNIFMGRLNQGMHAKLLGEHVTLQAQRAIARERHEAGITTRLIVASVREWETLARTAGCDVFTAPCQVLQEFISKADTSPDEIESMLEASYADQLGVDPQVTELVGDDRIAGLYEIDDEFVDFLHELRESEVFMHARGGDELFRHFDRAGFGDFFYSPSPADWKTISADKLPDLQGQLTKKISLDTLYSLLADADFHKHQEQMDSEIRRRAGR